jgi:PKD repeat protein
LTASDLEFCEGDSTNVSLYVSSNDPQVSYLWSPSSIVGTNDTVLVSPTSTTVYTVSATNLLGCTSSESVTVSFGAPPTPSFTHITGGINDAYFTNTSTNAETSHWYFGDGTDVFADNPSHIYPTAGVYVVKLVVISLAGCKDSIISQILVGTATIDELNESNSLEFNVYPNPSKGLFNIKLNSKDLSSTITVMNLLGEVILTKDLVQTANGNFESQIDLSNYPNGIYLIDMSTENQTVVRKISKQ